MSNLTLKNNFIDYLLGKNPNEIESYYLVQELVNKIQNESIDFKLNSKEAKKIRHFCNSAECSHEIYWAKKILNSKNPKLEIKNFPSYEYYEKLVAIEMKSLSYFSYSNKNVVFVGGGALPMTAILLAQKFNISSSVIEIDNDVYKLSKKLITNLELSNKIKIINTSGENFNYRNFNLIIIAVMAGINQNKKLKIIQKIKKTASVNSIILARSSYGKINYVYQSIPRSIFNKFDLILYVKPYNDVQVSHYLFRNNFKSG